MNYKAIIFDLDNTLLNFELCERRAILGALEDCAVSLDLNGVSETTFIQVFETYSSKYWIQREKFSPTELIEMSYQSTLAELNIKTDQISNLGKSCWQIFNHLGVMEPDVKEVLTVLAHSYRLAVITNGFVSAQLPRMQAAGIEHFFEEVVVSEAIGFAKPSPEIFHHALSRLDLTPAQVLYVGDSLTHDYAGAMQVNIDFCYYNRKNQVLPQEAQPKFMISELLKLLELVK
ncbi:HAD family hydrolase [Nostoc punctiforme]|uniref:HAD-superfamily hydrolase, subfamily IA, variant 1 n=1 Tax=Nostoc punctiforme (strain ATCC 29133 / PCC 73102) TaxID=63737 RepID=B2J8H6_NOSP7|nr:HAD family hydrolase [Nostoc punctiforme]ACC80953.1 HAD-superfamily hydrolase, subfamily IA, variant 1 [Nostoc punctiforme PCC 73102]